MKRKVVIEVLSSLLVLLFVYTSVSKWLDFSTFAGQMDNQPFPNWMTPVVVWTLPIMEVIISLLLMFNRTQLWGFVASLVLMLLFTLYTILILLNVFDRVPCSCGGVIENLSWEQHLVFNLFFVAVALTGIILKRKDQRITTTQNMATAA
ncbi:MauE/DoxX family redox-associated membrane protein [Paraflavitalea pollutisoli]|uniref:MauE/DoxX family redox-associated membrane protein n=1 Tax=Paraflavitalea pollutisoli TaxID=3034143 RepID=UPI0023EB0F5F|nr:MauE/DoxX family redox-associated membrane protein [Paraflavitalea sp. H1-2-19X]